MELKNSNVVKWLNLIKNQKQLANAYLAVQVCVQDMSFERWWEDLTKTPFLNNRFSTAKKFWECLRAIDSSNEVERDPVVIKQLKTNSRNKNSNYFISCFLKKLLCLYFTNKYWPMLVYQNIGVERRIFFFIILLKYFCFEFWNWNLNLNHSLTYTQITIASAMTIAKWFLRRSFPDTVIISLNVSLSTGIPALGLVVKGERYTVWRLFAQSHSFDFNWFAFGGLSKRSWIRRDTYVMDWK